MSLHHERLAAVLHGRDNITADQRGFFAQGDIGAGL